MRVFHFLPRKYGLQALKRQRLKVARINELNDPFELFAAELSNREERSRFLEWKNYTSNKIGFLCFSKNWKNPLLWAHYADHYRGVALELEVSNDLVVPVRYRKARIRLDIPAIRKFSGFSANLAEQLGSTKSTHWAYEEEMRVAVHLADCQSEDSLFFEKIGNGLTIVGIIAGAFCDLEAEELKSIVPKGKEVVLRRSKISYRSFDVVQNRKKPNEIIKGNG